MSHMTCPPCTCTCTQGGFFAIYDGHGGRDTVDFIASQLHRDVMRRVRTCTDVNAAIEQAFMATDAMMAKQTKYQVSGRDV